MYLPLFCQGVIARGKNFLSDQILSLHSSSLERDSTLICLSTKTPKLIYLLACGEYGKSVRVILVCVGSCISKMLKLYIKVYGAIGKMLSGELSRM